MVIKKIALLVLFVAFFSCKENSEIHTTASISCGQCKFELKEGGCDLAVKIDDKAYFVEGFGIDDFGDAHDKHTGFCNVIRKGTITGKIKDGKFLASSIKLLD